MRSARNKQSNHTITFTANWSGTDTLRYSSLRRGRALRVARERCREKSQTLNDVDLTRKLLLLLHATYVFVKKKNHARRQDCKVRNLFDRI